MKVAVVFLAVLVCALANEKYTTKYDNIDLDQILKSDRLLNNYVNCLLDLGSCTPDGKELKKSLPDALANDCTKCSEKQKNGSEKVIRYLINERPQVWDRLSKKYDPTGQYKTKFQNEATKRGIKL
ncbi:ejaculatory bulb-specific protein 3-like [Osmia lignaria lignaria]|uniref:ejaculatory bulb-specific protein 3-like n=1 Tax=Osmia bicornis bicornis TaxID=1437191 RepID=UPI0010F6EEC7|nr:ejaculatory bulb-specific protein 3-like [Osmia bicornis bicornis]XP_034196124.1 ejaculatory bulb-specific protein 3-like [Osmia lignaria]